SFNYLGRFDALEGSALFTRLFDPGAPVRAPRARRTHAVEIDASVVDRCLSVRWSWSRDRFEAASIARLADAMNAAIAALAPPRPRGRRRRGAPLDSDAGGDALPPPAGPGARPLRLPDRPRPHWRRRP